MYAVPRFVLTDELAMGCRDGKRSYIAYSLACLNLGFDHMSQRFRGDVLR
jgi:hypothetical protein